MKMGSSSSSSSSTRVTSGAGLCHGSNSSSSHSINSSDMSDLPWKTHFNMEDGHFYPQLKTFSDPLTSTAWFYCGEARLNHVWKHPPQSSPAGLRPTIGSTRHIWTNQGTEAGVFIDQPTRKLTCFKWTCWLSDIANGEDWCFHSGFPVGSWMDTQGQDAEESLLCV